jgi:hypothetical protein
MNERTRCRGEYLGLKKRKLQENGEDYTVTFIICNSKKKNDMAGTCSMNGSDEKYIENFGPKKV